MSKIKKITVAFFIVIIMLSACGGDMEPSQDFTSTDVPASVSTSEITHAQDESNPSGNIESMQTTTANKPKVTTAALKKTAIGWLEITKMIEPITFPLSDGTTSFSVYVNLPRALRDSGVSSLEDHTAIQEFIKLSGINLEFRHPPENDDFTYINKMIASGDLPDIINSNFDFYPGKITGAINDGIIIDSTDLIYAYGRNFLSLIGSRGDKARLNVMSDNGKIIRIGCMIYDIALSDDTFPGLEGKQNSGLIIRKDWLDDLGLSIPRTINEVSDLLIQFKDKKGVDIPYAANMFLKEQISNNNNAIASAYGVTLNGFQTNRSGKVQYSRVLPDYKEFLKLMNSWYNDGLIDKDFINRSSADSKELFINGDTGMIIAGNWELRDILDSGKSKNKEFDIIAIQAPRNDDPDARLNLSGVCESGTGGISFHISNICQDQILAIKWLDSLYMPEAVDLMTWGVGGLPDGNKTFEYDADGLHIYSNYLLNNEQNFNDLLNIYTSPDFQFIYDIDLQKMQYNSPVNLQALEAWSYNTTSNNRLPENIILTDEELLKTQQLQNTIDAYSNDMIVNFILGNEDIEPGFEAFIAQIDSLGLSELVEIYKNAFARYNSR